MACRRDRFVIDPKSDHGLPLSLRKVLQKMEIIILSASRSSSKVDVGKHL